MNTENNVQSERAEKIAAVNVDMANAQRQVEECYTAIGKLYVALHASDYESEFKPHFTKILEAEEIIRQCRARVREIMGVVCCDKCGHDVPKSSAFCSVCGAPMPDQVGQDLSGKVQCSVCGKYVEKNMNFCTHCSMPLKRISEKAAVEEAPAKEKVTTEAVEAVIVEKSPVVSEVPVEETPIVEAVVVEEAPAVSEAPVEETPAVEEEAPSARVCNRCGNAIKPGMMFCTACGLRAGEEAPAAVEAAPAKRVCKCGKEMSANARFCVNCGARAE